MNVEQILAAMDPEVYQRLCYAVETGKWPEGGRLTQEQRDSCQQAVMLYQSKYNVAPQHMSISAGGEIALKSKQQLKQQFSKAEKTIVCSKV